MRLSPLERKAAYAHAVTMRGKSKTAAAREDLGVTWTHLSAVLEGERDGSPALRRRFADYIGVTIQQCWPELAAATDSAAA